MVFSDQGKEGSFVYIPSLLRGLLLALLVATAGVVGFIVFERYLRVAAMILLLAGIFTYLVGPLVEQMVRWSRLKAQHVARVTMVLIVYAALAGLLYLCGASITHTLKQQYEELYATWSSASNHIPQEILNLKDWYESVIPLDIRMNVQSTIQQEWKQFPEKYVPDVVRWVLGFAKRAGEWLGLLIELVFVPLIAFYFLTDPKRVRDNLLFFIPKRHRESSIRYAQGMNCILKHYVRGQLILCAIAWIAVTVALLLMGIPGAFLLGVIAGVSRAIPVVGPVIGGVPVLGAVLLNDHWGWAFWIVLVGFCLLHLFESKYLMPRILGDQLGLHPVMVIVSLLIGYEMLGLLGMFLAPPAVAAIRFILAVRRGEAGGAEQEGQLPLPGIGSEPESVSAPSNA